MQLNRPFAAVTPTLDGDVLAVLASSDSTFTTTQIQRILTTASGEGIRKVLTRLTAQGVVVRDRVGRTNTYRLNAEHLAAEPILALARLTSTFLERLQSHLANWREAPKYAAVFGSAATGRMTLDSDIDLFLVRATKAQPPDDLPDSGHWEQQVTDLARSITAWTGNDGRIVEYTEEDLSRAIATGETLPAEIAAHALTIAGHRSWLKRQLSRRGNGRNS